MEAENYLAAGYGTRIAIETKPSGWSHFSDVADVSQPPRLKGAVVSEEFGKPYLSATQVFDLRPISRRFLSIDQIPDPDSLYVTSGQILVTRSGSVGRSTLAHSVHGDHIISDDLLRVAAKDESWWGWIYSYLRAPTVRAMMSSAQYGHIIKHLEVGHLSALPVVHCDSRRRERFTKAAKQLLVLRDEAHKLIVEAEEIFESAFGRFTSAGMEEASFVGRAQNLFGGGRRRFDAWHHNPAVKAIESHLNKSAREWSTVTELGYEAWLPTRFRRIAAADGVPFLDSSNLFEINPDISKRIADKGFGDPHNGRVQRGWLLLARSGQIYGVNGSMVMASEFHEGKIISDHVIRLAPRQAKCLAGYLLVAMTHPTLGRPRVKSLPYGSSIPEIEVADVESFKVPRLIPEQEAEISERAVDSARLRGEADELEVEMAEHAEAIIGVFLSATK